jgi:GNAT superfamily N-acetyltransferase
VLRIQGVGGTAQIGIRQASRADCDAIGRFLAGLSPKTRYLRFFSGAPSVSGAMLRRLAGEGGNVDVVVATEDGAIIGHAMAAGASGPAGGGVAEIGVVVTDTRQGRGVGTALTRELAARARANGTRTLTMDVMAENGRALAMINRAWPAAHYQRSGPYITIHASLARPEDGASRTDSASQTASQTASPVRTDSAGQPNGTGKLKEERPGEPVPSC